jgi:hypothetical protein
MQGEHMNEDVTPERTKAGSINYREAGQHLRLILARATRARLNGSQWRVLAAVMSLTVSYSKAYDRTYVARIAELAELDRKDPRWTETRRALKHLAQAGVISYDPAARNRMKSLVGVPPSYSLESIVGGQI